MIRPRCELVEWGAYVRNGHRVRRRVRIYNYRAELSVLLGNCDPVFLDKLVDLYYHTKSPQQVANQIRSAKYALEGCLAEMGLYSPRRSNG